MRFDRLVVKADARTDVHIQDVKTGTGNGGKCLGILENEDFTWGPASMVPSAPKPSRRTFAPTVAAIVAVPVQNSRIRAMAEACMRRRLRSTTGRAARSLLPMAFCCDDVFCDTVTLTHSLGDVTAVWFIASVDPCSPPDGHEHARSSRLCPDEVAMASLPSSLTWVHFNETSKTERAADPEPSSSSEP